MRICFVCQGNIIRSPLAENLFRQMAENHGAGSDYQVDSAGTSAYHVGEQPDLRMREVVRRFGLEYSGQSRLFSVQDLDRFDLVIAMDRPNHRIISASAQNREQLDRIRLMREFDPQASGEMDVPDPYYGGPDGFERTYVVVRRSVEGLFQELESGRNSP